MCVYLTVQNDDDYDAFPCKQLWDYSWLQTDETHGQLAGILATKQSKGMAVAARTDKLVFHKPVKIGAIVTYIGQLADVGFSSMQIFVKVVVNEGRIILKAS